MKETALAELLLTKFAHDMAGTIGAINNGLELMQEEDETLRKQAADLLESSAREALSRLQFFRFIYGITDDEGKISFDEFKSLVGKFYENSKFSIEYINNTDHSDFLRETAKLLGNLIYTAAICLPRGGKLSVDMADFKKTGAVNIHAENDNIKVENQLKEAVLAKEIPSREKEIQPYYAALLAKKKGFVIDIVQLEKSLQVKLLPANK